MQASISGFHNAPVSKAVLTLTLLGSLITSATRSGTILSLSSKPIFIKYEYWRIFSYQLCFASAGELVVGLALLYQFRLFERHWGSRKFGTFLLISSMISAFLGCCVVSALHGSHRPPHMESLPLGPYGFIFSCLVQWFFEIPISHSVRIMGINISDKSFVYLLAFQLSVSFQPSSIVAAFIGIIAGLCYRTHTLRSLLVPKSWCALCGRYLLPLLESPLRHPAPTHQQMNREREMAAMFENNPHLQQAIYGMAADRRQGGGAGAPELHRRAAAQPGNRHASDASLQEALQTLAGMGFTDAARNQRLLVQHAGNVQRVLDELLH
jgi:membrane associated rhomboid family serine protease